MKAPGDSWTTQETLAIELWDSTYMQHSLVKIYWNKKTFLLTFQIEYQVWLLLQQHSVAPCFLQKLKWGYKSIKLSHHTPQQPVAPCNSMNKLIIFVCVHSNMVVYKVQRLGSWDWSPRTGVGIFNFVHGQKSWGETATNSPVSSWHKGLFIHSTVTYQKIAPSGRLTAPLRRGHTYLIQCNTDVPPCGRNSDCQWQ